MATSALPVKQVGQDNSLPRWNADIAVTRDQLASFVTQNLLYLVLCDSPCLSFALNIIFSRNLARRR